MSAKQDYRVDGFTLEENSQTVQRLHDLLAARASAPSAKRRTAMPKITGSDQTPRPREPFALPDRCFEAYLKRPKVAALRLCSSSWRNTHRFHASPGRPGGVFWAPPSVLLRVAHGVGDGGQVLHRVWPGRAEGGRGLEWRHGQTTELVWEDYSSWAGPTAFPILAALYPAAGISGGFALTPALWPARSMLSPSD